MNRRLAVACLLCFAGCVPPTEGDAGSQTPLDGGEDLDAGAPAGDAGPEAERPIDAGPPVPPDETCTTDGCLVSVDDWFDWSVDALRPFVPAEVVLENGYRLRRIVFRTQGREARAVVAVPWLTPAPPGGWHIAVNNPGTVGAADGCAAGEGDYGAGLAGLYGARRLIGVAVDYPGLGTAGPHPYLVKEVEGRASLDAIRATLQLATLMLEPLSGRAVVTGLSQGGHATLAAAELHQDYAPELDIAAFAVAGPAAVWLEHWQNGLGFAGAHHVYTALLTWAWATHYDVDVAELFSDGVLPILESLMESACLYGTDPTLADALPLDPAELFQSTYAQAWNQGDLSMWPALEDAWAANRAGGWGSPGTPLRVVQGAEDDVVLKEHTDTLVASLEGMGVDVDYVVVAGGGHTDVAFNALALPQLAMEESLVWLRQRLANEPPSAY